MSEEETSSSFREGTTKGGDLFILQKGNLPSLIGYILLWGVFILAIFINSSFQSLIKTKDLEERCSFSTSDITTIVSICNAITFISGSLLYVMTITSFHWVQKLNWYILIAAGIALIAGISYINSIISAKSAQCQQSFPNTKNIKSLSTFLIGIVSMLLIVVFLHRKL